MRSALLFALVTFGLSVIAGERDSPPPRGGSPVATAGVPVSPELAQLEMYVGPWNLTEHHFNSRGEEIASVKGTEVIIWVLDHRAIRRTYTTANESTRYQAVGTITWNAAEKKYHGVWFDNASTNGPTTARGDWDQKEKMLVFTLESQAADGSKVQHKVVEQFLSDERRVATTYLIVGKDVTKRMEVHYQRATPCPEAAGIGIIGGPENER